MDFRQTRVDDVRPEQMIGRSTNNLGTNFAWSKKGILSFSSTPPSMLGFAGACLFACSLLCGRYRRRAI